MLEFSLTPFTTITTDRLVLRECRLSDAPEFHAMRSDPDVMRYLDRAVSQNVAAAREKLAEIIAHTAANTGITWAITLPEEDRLIGTILLFHFDMPHHRGEIGYMLSKKYHRRGYMQEAITAVMEYGFRTLDLHTLEGNINPGNDASRAILEKNGFVQEAHYKENYFWKGEFLDTVILSRINPYH